MHKKQKKRTALGAFFSATIGKSPVLVTLMGLVRTTGGERSETECYVISFSRLQNGLATSR